MDEEKSDEDGMSKKEAKDLALSKRILIILAIIGLVSVVWIGWLSS